MFDQQAETLQQREKTDEFRTCFKWRLIAEHDSPKVDTKRGGFSGPTDRNGIFFKNDNKGVVVGWG